MSLGAFLDRIVFPLAANGPFVPVSTNGARPGTYDEAVAAGGLDRGGLTSPFVVKGVNLGEVFTGGMMQELWEMAVQQVQLLLAVVVSIVGNVAVQLLLAAGGAGGTTHWLLLAVGALATFFLIAKAASFQTSGSEEESHAISLLAAMQFDGVTEARARQQFVDNLSSYDYSDLQKETEEQLYNDVTLDRPYAQKWLSRPVNQARAAAFRKMVTDQPRDRQIAEQVALPAAA